MAATASTIGDRRAILYDDDLNIRTSAAASATVSSTGISLPADSQDMYEVVIDVANFTSYSAGTAEWTITVEVSASLGSGYVVAATIPPAVLGAITAALSPKRFQVPMSGIFAQQLVSASVAYIRVTATKTGSPGNLTYGAFINAACC